jgi:hypothetical protein
LGDYDRFSHKNKGESKKDQEQAISQCPQDEEDSHRDKGTGQVIVNVTAEMG